MWNAFGTEQISNQPFISREVQTQVHSCYKNVKHIVLGSTQSSRSKRQRKQKQREEMRRKTGVSVDGYLFCVRYWERFGRPGINVNWQLKISKNSSKVQKIGFTNTPFLTTWIGCWIYQADKITSALLSVYTASPDLAPNWKHLKQLTEWF